MSHLSTLHGVQAMVHLPAGDNDNPAVVLRVLTAGGHPQAEFNQRRNQGQAQQCQTEGFQSPDPQPLHP